MTEDNGQNTPAPDVSAEPDDAGAPSNEDAGPRTSTSGIAQWNNPSPGSMTAVLLDMSGISLVEISQTDPGKDIPDLVGDPLVNQIRHLYTTSFWVGDNSVQTAPPNRGATRFLRRVLNAARDGGYPSSDRERRHAHQLLARANEMPVIYGPCLITGSTIDGKPAPLSKSFQDWFTALLETAARLHNALGLVTDILGDAVDMVDRITIIDRH